MKAKINDSRLKAFLLNLMKALFTTYAFTVVFHPPLIPEHYEKVDYLTASIYELLGKYDLLSLCLVGLLFFFYQKVSDQRGNLVLSVFFSICILIAKSYNEVGNWSYCFGSIINFIKFVISIIGYTWFFHSVMGKLKEWMEDVNICSDKSHFFEHKGFFKAFLILVLAYTPIMILSYPGNLCWDVVGQIEQVIDGAGAYSTHHPLLHTLIVGGLTKFGQICFGSYEIGLFLYVWVQMMMLTATMAATIWVLAKRKVRFEVLCGLMALYIITPIYSNLASTAVKDVPFSAAVVAYLICFSYVLEDPKWLNNKKFLFAFIGLQILVILFRNNGLPLILLSGIGGFLATSKGLSIKDKCKSLMAHCVVGVVVGTMISSLLAGLCHATSGSKGEIFSLFFQQTARYVKEYSYDMSEDEIEAIEVVLGDVEKLAELYDPDIADEVKERFKKDATTQEIMQYFMAWAKGLFKHPDVYVQAYFHHVYGWFAPNITNAIRYEIDYDGIGQGLLFKDAEKIMIFFYRFAERISLLNILQNVGFFVWMLFFYADVNRKTKCKALLVSSLPLWVSLLVCMAAPCFFGHPRYALPIMLGIPFLYGFALSKREGRISE